MRLALELLVLFLLWLLCTTLGTCRPVTTEKLPFHTCGEHNDHPESAHKALSSYACSAFHVGVVRTPGGGSRQNRAFSHHESWNNRLLELCFEGVHQLFGFGVVERENTCRRGGGCTVNDAGS